MLALYVLCSARSSFISILFLFPSRRLCRRGGGAVLRLQAVWWVSAIAGPGPLLLVCTACRWCQFSQWSHKGCFSFRAVFDLAIVQLQQSARLRGRISLPLKKKQNAYFRPLLSFLFLQRRESGEVTAASWVFLTSRVTLQTHLSCVFVSLGLRPKTSVPSVLLAF